MRRRHERRQVPEPVAVDAPDDRAEHLEAGRDADHHEHLRTPLGRERPARGDEHGGRHQTEHDLPPAADDLVDREQRDEVGAQRRDPSHAPRSASSSSNRIRK